MGLKARGWTPGAPRPGRGLALVIAKRSGKKRRFDDEKRFENAGRALTIAEENRICNTSRTIADAALRAEEIMLGRQDPGPSASGERTDDIDALVSAGVDQKLAQLGLTPEVLAKLTASVNQPEVPRETPPKKRGGRPKGSKNKKTLEAEARLAEMQAATEKTPA